MLFSTVRPYLRKIAAVPQRYDGEIASTGFAVLRPSDGIEPCYLFYKTISHPFVRALTGEQYGVSYPAVKNDQVTAQPLELPPTNEQRRIVERIEALFAEIDHGVESLEAARAALGLYRQSLLKAAFGGRLTEAWRAANPDLLETPDALLARIRQEREARHAAALADWKAACTAWEEGGRKGKKPGKPRLYDMVAPLPEEEAKLLPKLPNAWGWVRMGQVFGIFVGATPSRKEPKFWGDSIHWVSSGEVQFGTITDTREKITEAGFANMSGEIHPPGTVMLGMIGEGKTRGQSAILACHATHNQNCAAIRVSETEVPPNTVFEFLRYRYDETRRTGSGNNQPALNKGLVQALPFPICSPNEQREIVAILDARLSVADMLANEIEAGLKRASALRQSILTQAFSGRLVPQDLEDEPAAALLDRIRAERAAAPKAKRRRMPKEPA